MEKPIKTIVETLNKKSGQYIDAALSGTHNHYLTFLPADNGGLISSLLKRLFSNIKIDKSQLSLIENINDDGIIIYATKYKSYLEYLFYHTLYKIDGVPCPEISFEYKAYLFQPIVRIFRILLAHLDYFFHHLSFPNPYRSGYFIQELTNGRAGFVSLIDKKSFYNRFVKATTDPIRFLIALQESIDKPVFIIPQLLFYNREARRADLNIIDMIFGTKENPGRIRRLFTLINNPKKLFVEISDPVNLQEFLMFPEINSMDINQKTHALRRHLLAQINRHRQSITGPVLKSRQEIKQNVLTDARLQNFMADFAKKNNMSVSLARKKAAAHLEEIAANFSWKWVKVYDVILTWLLNNIFEGMVIDYDALNRIKMISKKGPLILAPCHKSHLDYLILSYIFYYNNMPCPHIAAGKNLSFWPLGTIFRGGGAFFLRRTFRGAKLYAEVFSAYVKKLLDEGFNIEFFIEGGRSRTGKVLKPKLGFLSILLTAFKDGACDDLIFVPINIGYDRVLEEKAYRHEIEGGKKTQENLKQVIKARKFLKKRYGKVYVNFAEPISLTEYLRQNGLSSASLESRKTAGTVANDLAFRIVASINEVALVTPYGLVASAILNCSKKKFSYDHLMAHLETYISFLFLQKTKMADTLLSDRKRAFHHVLETFIQRQYIACTSGSMNDISPDTQFVINTGKRPDMEYYKNNCIAAFIPAAFTALSILKQDAFMFSVTNLYTDYFFLKKLFKNEFIYDDTREPEHYVRQSIDAFADDAMIILHATFPDTYNLTSTGYKKLRFFAGFLKTYFESYSIVLNFYTQHREAMPKGNYLKKIQAEGNRMYKKNEIERIEALSEITYKNADHFFTKKGVLDNGNDEKIRYFENHIQKYAGFLP